MRWILLFVVFLNASKVSLALVGGQKAAPDQFPSVVLMEDCTVEKIGDHHFQLAAHCVVTSPVPLGADESYANQINATFGDGKEVRLDRDVTHKKGHWTHTLHVVRTFVHPAYRYSSFAHAWLKPHGISDIAVVVVKEETPEIPVIGLDFTPLKVGEEIVKLGYGCPETLHKKILEWIDVGDRELSFAASKVADGVESIKQYHDSAKKSAKDLTYFSTATLRDFIAGSFTVTRGKYHAGPPKKEKDSGDAAQVSLGFSDSGGPVLVKRKGKFSIVGVNAKSLLWPDEEHVTKLKPVAYDLHTRLDSESFSGTAEWMGKVLALTPAKAKGLTSLDGQLADVVEGKTTETEELITRKYLRAETKKLALTLTAPTGKPCPRTLEKVSVYDLNLQDTLIWATEPDEDNDEKALIAAGPGKFTLSSPDTVKVESLKLTFSRAKATEKDGVCLIRLE